MRPSAWTAEARRRFAQTVLDRVVPTGFGAVVVSDRGERLLKAAPVIDADTIDDAACGSMRVEESSLLAASFRGAELTGARFDRYTSLEFAMFDQQLEHIPRTDELGVG